MDGLSPAERGEQRRVQAERALRLHRVVRAAVSATDAARLLHDACHELVENGAYAQAWAFLTDEQGRLSPATPSGMTPAFEVMLTEVGQGRLPVCLEDALRGEAPVRYASAGEICKACPVRAAHDEGEVWVIPLRDSTRSYGVLFVLGPETLEEMDAEATAALLQEAGEAIAAGLRRLAQDQARLTIERRFQRLVNNLMGMVYQCRHDEHWTMEYLSAGAFNLTGYRPEQLLQNAELTYEAIVHPDDRERVRAAIQEALAEEKSFVIRYRIQHADGSIHHVVERGHLVPNGGPDTGTLEGIVTDVTEQVEQEARVQAATDELAGFFDVAPDLYAITDNEGRILKLNRQWEQVLGYPLRDMQGALLLDLVHPNDLDATLRTMREAATGEPVIDFVNRYRRADGAYIHLEWRAHPHGDFNFAVARDITERLAHVENLRLSEERFRMLIEGAPEPIFVQLEGNFEYLNQAACVLFGVDCQEDLVGQPVLERFHPKYRKKVQERIRTLIEQQLSVPNIEERILRVDGFEVPVEVSAVPYANDGRRGALVFMHDLTMRLRIEEKHRELEVQLQQAQKMESVGRLAGGVAHDFNNLLVPILGHAEILAEDLPAGHPAHASLSEIIAAADRARNVASQLLSFSRKQPLEMESIDLNAVVAGFQSLLGSLLGEDIAVSIHLAPGLLIIQGAPPQLEQVLLNLAVNARDAMPNGGRFRIETAAVEIDEEYIAERPLVAPGDYALLAVTDEGCGMDEATRNRIFDPFFTTKEQDKGTGLGLSNVYGIVKQHNGQIWVYSEPGHGTTFKVYIPLLSIEPTEYHPQPPIEEASHRKSESPARVLVLEDQHAVRLLVVKMLERMGHEPIEASTLAEARELAAQTDHIDLMISDVILPDGKGPDAYTEVQPLHPEMGIIFMSGYTEHVVVDDHTIAGTFLQKPFTARKLQEVVERVLAGAPPKW